jgi:uncharacterized protein (DUF1330 family)/predicted ester cyclase
MPAYSITQVEVVDEDGAQRYAELAQPAIAQFGGRFRVLAAEPTAVEGDWPSQQRYVVIEWPDTARLRAWYDSVEYAPAREVARTALQRRLAFFEGFEEPGTSADSAEVTVRRFYEALSSGDTGVAKEILAPDWEDIPLPPDTSPGSEGFKQTVAALREAFPDLEAVVEDIVVSGDRVAVRVLARGTHRGEILGVEPTDREVEFRAFDFHRLEGGRIVQSWHLEDLFGLLGQIQPALSAQD